MKFLANLSKKQIIIVLAAIVIGIGAIAAVAINAGGGKEKTVEIDGAEYRSFFVAKTW